MKRAVGLIISVLLLFTLAACGVRETPPDDGTPDPPPFSGAFVSEYGTMTFNGDGQSISAEFADSFAELSGLPKGKIEGSYVFLFGHGKWRCDKAEYFRIIVGDKNYQFRNAPGVTNESAIVFYPTPESDSPVKFVKQ